MKKILTVLTTALLLLSVSGCTINKPSEPERNITVTGSGSVLVPSEMVSITFLVRTIEWNVNRSVEKNAEITNKVIEAIKNAGIDAEDISTKDYNITQDLSKSYPGQYTVTNSIDVLIRNKEIAGTVIDTAVVNGANGLTNYEYLAGDKTTALRQARTLAIQNAQDAANLLAGASGAKVGEVMEIIENFSTNPDSPGNSTRLLKAYSTPILDGFVKVESSVAVRYSLE